MGSQPLRQRCGTTIWRIGRREFPSSDSASTTRKFWESHVMTSRISHQMSFGLGRTDLYRSRWLRSLRLYRFPSPLFFPRCFSSAAECHMAVWAWNSRGFWWHPRKSHLSNLAGSEALLSRCGTSGTMWLFSKSHMKVPYLRQFVAFLAKWHSKPEKERGP